MARQGGGPTVRRMLVGSQLRRLRAEKGISREEAGEAIRASEWKIHRLENGQVRFKERDITDLLQLYGVSDDQEIESFLVFARNANSPGWWHQYNDVLPQWFRAYVDLEAAANLIRTYEGQLVPGLLQTEDYTRAVIHGARTHDSPDEVERKVALRMARQELLTRVDGPRLWAVVDEATLRRPVGGREVMRGQIERLIEATKLPGVILQVLPFRVGGHTAEAGAFTILRYPESDLPDVVYVEQLTSALYLDRRDDVDAYMEAMERLCVVSAPPDNTADLLSRILQEM